MCSRRTISKEIPNLVINLISSMEWIDLQSATECWLVQITLVLSSTLVERNVKVTLFRKYGINHVSTNSMDTTIQSQKVVKKDCRVFTVKVNNVSLEEEYDKDLSWGSGEDVEGEVVTSLLKSLIERIVDIFHENVPSGWPST